MLTLQIKQWPFVRWERTPSATSKAIGWLAIIVMTLAGSTGNAFAKSLTAALAPLTIVFLSELLTVFFVFLSFGTLPTLRRLCNVRARTLLPVVAIGVCSSILAPFLWYSGLHWTSAVNAANPPSDRITSTGAVTPVVRSSWHSDRAAPSARRPSTRTTSASGASTSAAGSGDSVRTS